MESFGFNKFRQFVLHSAKSSILESLFIFSTLVEVLLSKFRDANGMERKKL
jgi:hypothetical protein